MAYFYLDFRDISKQHWRDLVPSLLIQLTAQSGPRCDILSRLYSNHDSGSRQPNDDILTQCLKEMSTLPDQRPIYLIFDAFDGCSNVSGIPTPRKRVLQLVKELVDFHIPNLHICVTGRPEVDIRDTLRQRTRTARPHCKFRLCKEMTKSWSYCENMYFRTRIQFLVDKNTIVSLLLVHSL
jgi:hypothetical protein